MSAPRLHLGFDIGTQGTKGLVIDAASGSVLCRAGRHYGLIAGQPPGAAEQDPETWVQAVAEVATETLGDPRVDPAAIRGLGVSGQQHGLVALDERGGVLRPAPLWCDTRAAAEARELSRRWGRSVPAGFTAPKVLWLQRHEPELWRRVRSVLLPHDYLNLKLTGRKTMEAGDASGTGWFDPVRRCFDAAAVTDLGPGFDELLPPLLEAGTPAGSLDESGAALLGLPTGISVSTGGGDNMMSAIGSGATRPGVVVLSLGTSGTVFCHADRPIVDPAGLIAPFCDSTGGWLPLLCTMNATGVSEEVRAAFEADSAEGLEELTRAAEGVAAGCDGLLLLPYIQGERVPDLPNASGALLGMRPGLLRPGHLFRAALEGTTLVLAWGIERMERLGVKVEAVRLVGGGARNRLWRRIVADVLQVPVTLLAEPDSAALGAAIHSLWTVARAEGQQASIHGLAAPFIEEKGGALEPDPQVAAVYSDARRRLVGATQTLFGGEVAE